MAFPGAVFVRTRAFFERVAEILSGKNRMPGLEGLKVKKVEFEKPRVFPEAKILVLREQFMEGI